MAGRRLVISIYYLILVTCIGISTFLSFEGLWENLKNITYPSVMVIALGLFSAGLLLQQGRDKRSILQQFLAMILFALFASASTSSNINFIYTERMWQEVRNKAFEEEYLKYKDTLRGIEADLLSSAESDLAYFGRIASTYNNLINQEISSLKRAIETSVFYNQGKQIEGALDTELRQMLEQALDPVAPGCGPKCRAHMDEIDKLVPTTDTIMPKGKTAEDIKRNWSQYRNIKMKAFCSDAKFSNFHQLRGLVEVIPVTDFCFSVGDYAQIYDSNRLEKLRAETATVSSYNENSLKDYLAKINEISKELEVISLDVIGLSAEFESLEDKKNEDYPKSIEDAALLTSKVDQDFKILDVGRIQLRADLFSKLYDKDFLSAKVNSQNEDEDKLYLFDFNLTHSDVVTDRNEQIQPFLEVLSNKQNEIIGRYNDAFTNSDEKSFQLVDTQNGKIGEIEQTLRHAFVEMPNQTNTVFAVILGLAFDLIPVIFAFVAFHGYVPEEREYNPVIG